MARKNQNISRILSALIMKQPSGRKAVVQIVKEGQRAGRTREWMITMLSVLLVEKFAARFRADQLDPRMRARYKRLQGREMPEVEIGGDDIKKAAARLLRKVPMLEKCDNDPPEKLPRPIVGF
jgi:hypothetical protein